MASSLSKTTQNMIGKLHPSQTMLLVCDMQERFRPLIDKMTTVIQTTKYMTSVASVLEIPILATQQYTKVFGSTIPECFAEVPSSETSSSTTTPTTTTTKWNTLESMQASNMIFEKKLFSMITPQVQSKLEEVDYMRNKTSFVLVGIETHVCVQQTCLDLLELGKQVHIIVDGVSSQQTIDRSVALQRMQQAGAFLTTAQSATYMLLQSANHVNFKTVSKLTVEHMKLINEFNN